MPSEQELVPDRMGGQVTWRRGQARPNWKAEKAGDGGALRDGGQAGRERHEPSSGDALFEMPVGAKEEILR